MKNGTYLGYCMLKRLVNIYLIGTQFFTMLHDFYFIVLFSRDGFLVKYERGNSHVIFSLSENL